MKTRKITLIVMLLTTLAITGVSGYWLGKHNGDVNAPPSATPTRQILYYRNPMGLPDTSPTPKKDAMGMDYLPVFADEAKGAPAAAGEVLISAERIQKLGARSEVVERRSVDQVQRVLRIVGRVERDERRTFSIAPRFDGWIERLHVNVTGQTVQRGQPLFEAYSPELISTQREYAIAMEGIERLHTADPEARAAMRQLADASLTRLNNWQINENNSVTPRQKNAHTLTFSSPVTGVVLEKQAVQGMRFSAGDALYQIADLSTVWVIADIPEQDLARVKVGQSARVQIDAYPERQFTAKVAYVYPTLNAATRTVPVRLEMPNPDGLLKPAMYASVELSANATGKALAVPRSAVIDSGARQIVLIDLGGGRFAPRTVKLGRRGEQYSEVLDGLQAGERVVVSANFLIDAESNLQAALSSFGAQNARNAEGH